MLGIFKKFWHRTEETNVVTVPRPSASARKASPAPRTGSPAPNPFANGAKRAATPPPLAQPTVSVSARATTLPVPSVPGSVTITLGSIEPSLPEPLRHKIAGALHELVPVPINRVLPQLHRGAVSLTVKELRDCAPELLASFQGHDDIPVTLPLSDVVRQIDPKVLPRRGSQKRVEVPKEVTEIFTHTSDGLTVLASSPAAVVAVAETPHAAQPSARTAPTATATTATPVAAPAPAAPVAAGRPEKISLSPQALAALAAAAPAKHAAAKAAAPVAAASVAASQLPRMAAPVAAAKPAPAPAPTVAPVSLPKLAGSSTKPSSVLPMPLEKLVPALPPEICKELGDVDVKNSSVALPMASIESMLKSGKVLFTWGELTSWLTPPLPRPPSNSASSLLIELPLKVVAPVFMAHHRANTTQKRADTGEGIPDLFQSAEGAEANSNGSQVPATVSAPVTPSAAPAPTPATPAATTAAAKKASKAKAATQPAAPAQPALPPLEALLGTSAGRFSPKEVAQNVSKLPGVTGALIAMIDGLPVACVMPAGLKGDTLAAFLPQMFGRMMQYTKELGLGGLQSMTLNVEGGCWHVFKQPNIYFAVCGKPGEPMPFNLLAQVAADLSKQTI